MGKLKDKIQGVNDIQAERVDVPEWGAAIEVRTMKAIDRARILRECVDPDGKVISEKFQAGMIIASCFDPETGEKAFTSEDYDFLMNRSAGVIERLAGVAMSLSGFTSEALKAAEKNS